MVLKEHYQRVFARGVDQYQEVFPHVFAPDYQGRGLIIGSGLGNTVLHSNLVAIDPGYAHWQEMFEEFRQAKDDGLAIGEEDEIIVQLRMLQAGKSTNAQLVAGLASSQEGLPFAKNFFDDIISHNCLFGGLELEIGAGASIKLIANTMEHLKPGGRLSLFPHFNVHPSEIGFSMWNLEAPYVMQYLTQKAILKFFEAHGFGVDILETNYVADRLPRTLQTAMISKPILSK